MSMRRQIALRLPGGVSWRIDRRVPALALILALCLSAASLIGLMQGEFATPAGSVMRILAGLSGADDEVGFVVRELRLPRTLLAILVGAALALSGALMQSLTRNPLADPGIIGINSGAALAAVVIIVAWRGAPIWLLPLAAFGGAIATAAFIYAFAWRGGIAPLRLILVGIGVAALLGSFTALLTSFGEVTDVQRAFVWLSGSLYGRGWGEVWLLAAWMLVLAPLAWLMAGTLDTLTLGDDSAVALGLRLELARGLLIVVSAALAAAAVAAAGTLGFVGLVAPHFARRLVGPMHLGLLPIAALLGGLLVLLADLAGRTIIAPAQLPAGLLTAILGAPYFMVLLWTRANA
jgi:iron complex transport system permease protein